MALIEKQEAEDLIAVMAANPMDAQDSTVREHKQRPVDGFQLPLPAIAVPYRTKAGGSQQDRGSKVQASGTALAVSSDVFNRVGKGKAMASSAVLGGSGPTQTKRAMLLMYDEDGGIYKDPEQSTWEYNNRDAETEMQDAMRRMHIDDRIGPESRDSTVSDNVLPQLLTW